jgi:hypothetical protein
MFICSENVIKTGVAESEKYCSFPGSFFSELIIIMWVDEAGLDSELKYNVFRSRSRSGLEDRHTQTHTDTHTPLQSLKGAKIASCLLSSPFVFYP